MYNILLSPHLDDIAFSIGGLIYENKLRYFKPISIFTISDYWILDQDNETDTVTSVRKTEDSKYFENIKLSAPPIWLDYLDSPLRLNIEPEICCSTNISKSNDAEIQNIYDSLLPYLINASLIIAPLAIGNHIDHKIINRLACRLITDHKRVVFYEDLPYACEIDEVGLKFHLETIEEQIRSKLKPMYFELKTLEIAKRLAVDCYSSQIDKFGLNSMIKYSLSLSQNGLPCERLWYNNNDSILSI